VWLKGLFLLVAVLSVLGALGMLATPNPVHSVLYLVLTLFCVAAIYLMLGAEFLAVVQVIVYAGAIMVLFLFVIMLLNLGRDEFGADPLAPPVDGRAFRLWWGRRRHGGGRAIGASGLAHRPAAIGLAERFEPPFVHQTPARL